MDFTLNKLLLTSTNWLFPKKCINCGQINADSNHPCCADCYQHLPFQDHSCCRCGQAFSADADYCGRCIAKPPPFDACFCPFTYQTPINEQICRFKYHNHPELAHSLAQLMARELISNTLEMPELLIPAPLHISRLRERGFNQSVLLAKSLGKLLQLPVEAGLINKHRKTAPQAQLSLKQRTNNLTGSFKLAKAVSAKHVAIIDDVVTTGSTAAEIAKILRQNGVDYIQVWAVAHTV